MKRIRGGILVCIMFAAVVFSAELFAMAGKPKNEVLPAGSQIAKETLDGMIAAYSGRNTEKFMEFVANDFTGDRTLLDRSVRKDFSLFTDINISYMIDKAVPDTSGKVSVTVTFTRSHTVIQTGNRASSSGSAELLFSRSGYELKLYGMKPPLIFGVSGQ
ncbi:MAG: hypothetical protein HY809_08330 [Nitrospirae bacterium]|nr:hypothetical protein [Nitrospirota bacterium]